MIWTVIFVGIGAGLLVMVPVSIALDDPIWPVTLALGVAAIAFGLLIRWRRWV